MLKALAAAPIAAPALAESVKAQALTNTGVLGMAIGGSDVGIPIALGSDGPARYGILSDFVTFWREHGDHAARQRSRQVTGFDPDILAMHWPLTTKVRAQRERNYRIEKERLRRRFTREITGGGEFRWWPED